MARPLSDEKRRAILVAAAEQVATLGTAAPTAKIADAAGVSEGTLFTYFATKEKLLNQLFLEIEADLEQTLAAAFPETGKPRERIERLWDALIEWGIRNPIYRKALRQLKVSDRITADSRHCSADRFGQLRAKVERTLSTRIAPDRLGFYIGTVLNGLADLTIDAIAAGPKDDARLRQAGFDFFWKGSGR